MWKGFETKREPLFAILNQHFFETLRKRKKLKNTKKVAKTKSGQKNKESRDMF
jgi:hypothetical protein